MAFRFDSQFNQITRERVAVYSQSLRGSVLIAHVVPQRRLDESSLKFPHRLRVKDVSIHHPAHKAIQF